RLGRTAQGDPTSPASASQSAECSDAEMDEAVIEPEHGSGQAVGDRPVLLALANCPGRVPAWKSQLTQRPFHVRDLRRACGFSRHQSLNNHAGKEPVPYLLTCRWFVKEIDGHNSPSDGDGQTATAFHVRQSRTGVANLRVERREGVFHRRRRGVYAQRFLLAL